MDNEQNTAGAGFTYEQALAFAKTVGENVVPTFCAMCGPTDGCGLYAFTRDGKLSRVIGMAEGQKNRGGLCPKAFASAQWLNSPERLTTPLKRTGERGEGKFMPISWDEAIKNIADKLLEQKQKYGPESLAILSPAARNYKGIMLRFLAVHGSPNYGHSGICHTQRSFAFNYTLGCWPQPDYKNCDLIVYWARQPVLSGPATVQSHNLIGIKKRGAKIVAIKPSMEVDAGMADVWIPLRPGTDAALALTMLHIVISEDLVDKDFIRDWCYGFDELKTHVSQYTPSWGERITGVPAQKIIDAARLYAGTKSAAIDLGNGVEHTPSSNDAIRAIAILIAITGHLDRPGCNLISGSPEFTQPNSDRRPDLYTTDMVDRLVGPEFPPAFQPFIEGPSSAYYRILESVLTEKPYPIRTIIAPGTQPLVSTRGTKHVIEALKKVDFFVTLDVTRPAEMAYADIVLPTTTPYESDHPFELQGNWLMARSKVSEPLGDYKSMHEFFIELGAAMGYEKDFWNGSIEAYENFRLEPYGITIDDLRSNPVGIRLEKTSDSEITYEKYAKTFAGISPRLTREPYLPQSRVALYNTSFEKEGFTPMPEWREPPESLTGAPELADRYPLVLSDYHTTKSFIASWLRNIPLLREIQPYPAVHIHPESAAARGIRDGDWVKVESPHGWLKVKAEYYPGIRPDTVMILHGWWQGCKELGFSDLPITDGGANVNHLYSVDPDKAYDPIITAMSSQTLVEVSVYE